ncbi:MAG: hypothetical protein AB7G76_10100 [Steroidobacteraceae bacterium]
MGTRTCPARRVRPGSSDNDAMPTVELDEAPPAVTRLEIEQ